MNEKDINSMFFVLGYIGAMLTSIYFKLWEIARNTRPKIQ